MTSKHHTRNNHLDDRGVSILIIAVSMIFILGMAGLGIDLASLYVGRSQAQRAADAAALAGAQAMANANGACVNGGSGSISSACMALARSQAEAVGNQNLVAGISPGIQDSDITFPSTSVNDPQVQVIAARDSDHGNPMPTFFVKIFGITQANVSALAVAEAYSSNGTGPQVGARCVKPWLVPNCDPGNVGGSTANGCPSGIGGFVIPQSGGISSTLSRGAAQAPAGPIGESFVLKPGSPGGAAAPGQYYAAFIPNTTQFATECPSCATNPVGNGGSGSAAVYRTNIECCNNTPIVCGSNSVTLQSTAGNMVGPTQQGVDCLIHQSGSSFSGDSNCGQDRIGGNSNPCSGPPPSIVNDLSITAGPNNPYVAQGTGLSAQNSDSVVALPIWDGTPLQSGQNPNVNIVGFLQLFIQSEGSPQGTVYGTVLGVTACGDGGGGTGGTTPIVASGGSPIPVRLIHN
ncbi:MAG TPA: pilus assembly protein TadG-related protein [Terriglobia bacterium]|nr:pilus assembly protein TadG-related protein [Terriglobia bacterium]